MSNERKREKNGTPTKSINQNNWWLRTFLEFQKPWRFRKETQKKGKDIETLKNSEGRFRNKKGNDRSGRGQTVRMNDTGGFLSFYTTFWSIGRWTLDE